MKKYPKYKPSKIEWIGEIPEHWEEIKLKYTLKFQTGWTPSTAIQGNFDGDNIWVTIADITTKYICDSKTKISNKAIEESNIKITPKGSLLYSFKLSLGKIGFASCNLYTNEAIISILPKEKLNLSYYYYSLSEQLLYNANENIYGAKILNQELINNALLIFPPYEEQEAIASFLDEKTKKIDILVNQKQKMIDLLKDERTAVINQAVTKGINPSVKMKPSGIEWLGEIPEHWDVRKLKWVAKLKSGSSITADTIKKEGDFPVYGGNGLRGFTDTYTHEGDYVLIGRQGALCGNINYAHEKFWASEHAVVATINNNFNYKWLGELLRIMNLNQYSQSAAQPGLSVENLKELYLPVPKLTEQQQIIAYIESQTNRIDTAVIKIKKEIELLQEYRQALISEAVTGKIDVRDCMKLVR